MGCEIRSARLGDNERLSELFGELGYAASPEQVADRMHEPNTQVLVAEQDGEVLGVVVLHVRQPVHRDGPVMRIDALVVTGARRSMGIGEALVRQALAEADRCGATLVEITSKLPRTGARRFYERLGFVVVGHQFKMTLERPTP